MQAVVTIEFNGRLHRIQAATPEDAIAELREEYEEAGPGSDVDLSTLTLECVTGIETYPTWYEFEARFKPIMNHLDTNASYGGHMFQTYCEERCFVHAQPLEHVWTIAEDCTEDLIWIHPGFYWINSIGHFITAYPWRKRQAKFLLDGDIILQHLRATTVLNQQAVTLAAPIRSLMTEAELNLIRDLFFECGETLTMFDERTDNKRLLFVTADEPTMLRYILSSPLPTQAQKEHARSELGSLMIDDDSVSAVQQMPFELDDQVLYCAPDGQLVDTQSPDVCPPEPIELTFDGSVPEIFLKIDPVYIDRFDTATDTIADVSPRCDSHYHAADQHGDLDRARCTRAATVRIRVTASDGAYEAKACASCAASGGKSAGTEGSPLAVEILGEAE